jgi:hypothetical protein
MLGKDGKVEDKSNSKGNGKANANIPTSSYVIDGSITFSSIGPRAVLEDVGRGVRFEGQVTLGAIGDGIVAVEGVVEVLEGSEVEVDSGENSVTAVSLIALRPILYSTGRDMVEGFE